MASTPLPDTYWLHAGLLAGPYPSGHGISALVAGGVTLFLDLTEAGELPPYAPELPLGIEHRRMPIRDFTVPTPEEMEQILHTLAAALTEGHTIYLHCHGGIGRTGTVAGCHLVRRGRTGAVALQEIHRLRMEGDCDPHSPETEAQRAMVRQWPSRISLGTR